MKKEYTENTELLIYKFDTDFWRDNSNFESVLNKYNITSIPALIKVYSNGEFEIFNSESELESQIQIDLNNFLNR